MTIELWSCAVLTALAFGWLIILTWMVNKQADHKSTDGRFIGIDNRINDRITDHANLRENVAKYHKYCEQRFLECRDELVDIWNAAKEAKDTAVGVAGTTSSFARTFNATIVRQDEKLAELAAEMGRTRLLLDEIHARFLHLEAAAQKKLKPTKPRRGAKKNG